MGIDRGTREAVHHDDPLYTPHPLAVELRAESDRMASVRLAALMARAA